MLASYQHELDWVRQVRRDLSEETYQVEL
jgi:hypothetical protein